MKRVIVVLAAALLVACGGGSSDGRPGSAAVYQRIESLTDCGSLQREFDTAEANFERGSKGTKQSSIELSYMDAANARLERIGCSGSSGSSKTFSCTASAIADPNAEC
jgi:hypothetical protein